ncbi:MAG TPA: glycosyltransferase family 4 protein [Actinomycetes bacterium]|nr:glycosyltransferase family 4 protein [Actinomycetes bacterium]
MVSTRFAGTDGVTLEAAKLAEVLEAAGHRVAWFAGELGERFQPGLLHPPAHFETPANRALEAACFGVRTRSPATTATIRERTEDLKTALRAFLAGHGVEVVVAQNVLCLPMQLPLGLALTEVLVEQDMPALAHHHDFWWERERFAPNAAADVLGAAFPPILPGMEHLVINSLAAAELTRRRGVAATVLPNVMDFERGPERPGDPDRFRRAAGLAGDDVLLLQPTRVVPRKGIETTIDLAAALDGPVRVVVTHAEGDEGVEYGARLREQAERLGVDLRFVPVEAGGADGPAPEPRSAPRSRTQVARLSGSLPARRARPRRQYLTSALAGAYAAADLVCYPSTWEGFGNALLEAFFHRRPVLVNRYAVYVADIAPAGVRCIELDGGLTPETVGRVRRLLADPQRWRETVEANYEACQRHFSYATVRERVLPLLDRVAAT